MVASKPDALSASYATLIEMMLEDWKATPRFFERMTPEREPSKEVLTTVLQTAYAFLTDTFAAVQARCRANDGVRMALTSTAWQPTSSVLALALLYTDTLVVFSGRAGAYDDGALKGVRDGAIILSEVPMWFRDMLYLRSAIESGAVISLPRHYYNARPTEKRVAWIIGHKYFGETDDASVPLESASVFAEMMRQLSLGLVASGTDVQRWQSDLVSALPVPDLAVRTMLSLDLPFLRNADVDTVCKLKADYAESFTAFRRELQMRIIHIQQLHPDASVLDAVRQLRGEWIDAELAKVKLALRRESQKRWATRAGVTYATGGLALSAMFASPWPVLLAAGGGVLLELARGMMDKETSSDLQANPLYGLWRLRKKLASGAGA